MWRGKLIMKAGGKETRQGEKKKKYFIFACSQPNQHHPRMPHPNPCFFYHFSSLNHTHTAVIFHRTIKVSVFFARFAVFRFYHPLPTTPTPNPAKNNPSFIQMPEKKNTPDRLVQKQTTLNLCTGRTPTSIDLLPPRIVETKSAKSSREEGKCLIIR